MPNPKYVANCHFSVGPQSFAPGDPVPAGRALELAITFGQVDSTAKSATTKPATADPPQEQS